MSNIKLGFLIQSLNSLIVGILGVLVPLMMKDRGVDIVTIGLVFASTPIIFQLGRMIFATASDFWGRKLFFVSNGFLNIVSVAIYYLAYTPLEFLFGKIVEGTKSSLLWAVNRPFLMEKSKAKWKTLVHMRAVVYLSTALGSLITGFLASRLFYDGTLLICIAIGSIVVPAALLLSGEIRKKFSMKKAIHLLDFRRKDKIFRIFLLLFFVQGLSFGFRLGFVFPLFLSENGFNVEQVGLIIGIQTLLAGVVSYLFSRSSDIRQLLIVGGASYVFVLSSVGFSSFMLAGLLTVTYGAIEGLLSVSQEGILSRIVGKESYGIDIGLLMMGVHGGSTISLALSGFLIANWGFASSFTASAWIYSLFFVGSYFILGRMRQT